MIQTITYASDNLAKAEQDMNAFLLKNEIKEVVSTHVCVVNQSLVLTVFYKEPQE
jgi:hypothetical protein